MVVAAPLVGHLLPLVPLAAALRSAGHEVFVVTGGDAAKVDTGGVPVRDIAPGFRLAPIAMRLAIRHPLLARAEFAGRAGTQGAARLFGQVNDQLADPMVEFATKWRPDLVILEPLASAALLAAAVANARVVLVENLLADGPTVLNAVAELLTGAMSRHDVAKLPEPAAVLTVRPPGLGAAPEHRSYRSEPAAPTSGVPDWLLEKGEQLRIVVSRSTIDIPGVGNPISKVFSMSQYVGAELVLVRAPDNIARLVILPENVRPVDWVPLSAVLPFADGFVHHGGAGSVLTAAAAGVPQLVVPGAGDRRINADRVIAASAGLAVPLPDITPDSLHRLVTDEALREGAARLKAEMAEMPHPEELVPYLESLAPADKRPNPG